MSIANAFITPDVAIVGFDTEGALPDGSRAHGAKIIVLPHLDAVVAFRGLELTLTCTTPLIHDVRAGFDELADAMPDIIAKGITVAKQYAGVGGRTEADAEQANFVLVGYSPGAGRVVGHAFVSSPGVEEIAVSKNIPDAIAPSWSREDVTRLNIKADRAGMLALMMDQCRLVRERGPAECTAGGRLFIAEVRKGSIHIEGVGHFPPR